MIILLVVSLSVRSGWFLCFKWGQFLVHLTKWALKWGRVLGVVKIDRAGSPGDAESYYSAAPPPNLHNTPHARPHTRTFTSNTTHTHTSAWFQKVESHFGVSVQYKRFHYACPAPPSTTMYQVHTMDPPHKIHDPFLYIHFHRPPPPVTPMPVMSAGWKCTWKDRTPAFLGRPLLMEGPFTGGPRWVQWALLWKYLSPGCQRKIWENFKNILKRKFHHTDNI